MSSRFQLKLNVLMLLQENVSTIQILFLLLSQTLFLTQIFKILYFAIPVVVLVKKCSFCLIFFLVCFFHIFCSKFCSLDMSISQRSSKQHIWARLFQCIYSTNIPATSKIHKLKISPFILWIFIIIFLYFICFYFLKRIFGQAIFKIE